MLKELHRIKHDRDVPEARHGMWYYGRLQLPCIYPTYPIQASQIQANVDEYEYFLFHPDTREPMSVPDFCNRVMGLGKEAGQSSNALCRANKTLIYEFNRSC